MKTSIINGSEVSRLSVAIQREEFVRLIEACRSQQTKNMWSLSVYTGIRPGELCALGWEDIDLKAGTMMIRRNLAQD